MLNAIGTVAFSEIDGLLRQFQTLLTREGCGKGVSQVRNGLLNA